MHDQAAAEHLSWWVWRTRRWGGHTRVAPFWTMEHYVNIFTQVRGSWWAWKHRVLDRIEAARPH